MSLLFEYGWEITIQIKAHYNYDVSAHYKLIITN